MLVGSAVLGAAASRHFESVSDAMAAMTEVRSKNEPNASEEAVAYHEKKYAVFRAMHAHQLEYRAMMQ